MDNIFLYSITLNLFINNYNVLKNFSKPFFAQCRFWTIMS